MQITEAALKHRYLVVKNLVGIYVCLGNIQNLSNRLNNLPKSARDKVDCLSLFMKNCDKLLDA